MTNHALFRPDFHEFNNGGSTLVVNSNLHIGNHKNQPLEEPKIPPKILEGK
jgi:hypothetical protein